jgi:hypothetical protein
MAIPSTTTAICRVARSGAVAIGVYPILGGQMPVLLALFSALRASRGSRGDIYNILWAVVFGFATLNILSLAARRFEPTRRGMSFGELMAIMVVLLSMVLLGWEMLHLFHVFPIRLRR